MTDPTLGNLMPTTPPPRRRRWPILAAAAAVVLLLAAGITAAYALTRPSDAERAEKACTEEYVTDRLRSPATARFDRVFVRSRGDARYRVSGTVDAENGFGALTRGTFACVVEVTDDGVRLIELDVDQPK
jgi:hypothetical protein